MSFSLDNLPPDKIAHFLSLESLPTFSPAESPVILHHQLNAQLLPDLASTPGSEPARLQALITHRPGTESFLRQLTFIHPSLELLQAIKNFARHAQSTPTHPLYGDSANLLYYAAIAAALHRCNTRITQLTNAQLEEGFLWSLAHPAAPSLHHILKAALKILPTIPNP